MLHGRDYAAVTLQVNVGLVGPVGGVDLNRAMSTVYNETRAFLIHNYDLTEDMVSQSHSSSCTDFITCALSHILPHAMTSLLVQ